MSEMQDDDDEFVQFAKENGIPPCIQRWDVELDEAPVAMSLSPKGQLLAVATVDDSIPVLDVASGKVAHTLAGHSGGTNGVAFLSGNCLASVGEDGTARVWNLARATCLHELTVDAEGADRTGRGHSVNHLTVAPGAAAFACAAGKLISVYRLGATPQQATTKRVLGPVEGTVESLRYDRRGNLLATYNGGVTYWDFRKDEQQELALPHSSACLSGDVNPGVEYIVTGCQDSTVHIFHFKAERDGGVEFGEMTCGGYDSKVTAVDFNPRGDRMASAGGDKNTVWNFSGQPTGTLPTLTVGHQAPITCQAWQPDGEGWLATAGKDGRLMVYDVDASLPMREGMPHVSQPGAIALTGGDEVTALIFARNGLLYTGHISGVVRAWELPVGGSSSSDDEQQPAADAAAAEAP
ncbi:hypothetical protein D9Q98_006185 [Chlorella vulgaris]|uniref:Uncharacterized protein n=1 Tax=Chlorella vulgaris TaxID=3077 RepID=A0A9D4TX54_CHLVU|nr:hypothetical protein D9Q98_006185 [Chlorella vulgaris]